MSAYERLEYGIVDAYPLIDGLSAEINDQILTHRINFKNKQSFHYPSTAHRVLMIMSFGGPL